MKRELKFKVWDKEKRRMSKPFNFGSQIIEWSDGDIEMPVQFAQSERFVFLQFTGIKDRDGNGVDVFEGDKIGRTTFWDKEIVWDKCGFYTISVNNPERKFPLIHLDGFDVVIGNIYEHSELKNA